MSLKALFAPTLNHPPKRHLLDALPVGETIPKIIHQTFYDRNLPERLQVNVQRLRELNPGWEYRFYDDADVEAFIKDNYPTIVWDYYQRIDPAYGAARADIFRYLLLYKVGGVYLDIKSSATRSLDTVLQPDDRFILSKWHEANGDYEHIRLVYDLRNLEGGEYQQWHIICAPGHPFLKNVLEMVFQNIDAYDPYLHQTGKKGVLRVTGPVPYTMAILPLMSAHPHRVVDGRNTMGLEYSVYGEQVHVGVFKGHYSLQTTSIVRLTPSKKRKSYFYRWLQAGFEFVQRLRGGPPEDALPGKSQGAADPKQSLKSSKAP
jgi:hypothetical protein